MDRDLRGFLREMKRRHVYRVAAVYAAVGFAVMQAAALIFPALALPGWAYSLVVVAVLLGFPVALVLAWALEVTPEGVRRTRPGPDGARRGEGASPVRGRRAARYAAGLLVAAGVGYGLYSMVGRDGGRTTPGRSAIRSLAVLPLDNFSGDGAEDYFVEGMTEALISRLGRAGELTVISRTSAMRYRDSDKALPVIARELGVDGVVEGSVLRVGDRVRITVQLIQADPERHLWARDYQRELRDVLSLQDEVARDVARQIRVTLSDAGEGRPRDGRSVDPDAYEAYLRGRHHWNRRDPGSLERALEEFRTARKIEPTWALPWAGIADVFVVPAQPLPPPEALPRAVAAARRALELDSTVAEAHVSLAYATMTLDYDWERAGRLFRRALELNPGYATGHQWYAPWLLAQGRVDEAVAEQERAAELDPLSPVIAWTLPHTLYLAGRCDEAWRRLREAEAMYPDHPMLSLVRRKCLVRDGDLRGALDVLAGAPGPPGEGAAADDLHAAFENGGWKAVARRYLEMWEPRCGKTELAAHPACTSIVTFLVEVGQVDRALDFLEAGLEERKIGWYVPWMVTDPALEPLRQSPRYSELLGIVGLGP
jgi:TolB-like protein/Flp pilus assembly protein TadD